MSIGSTYSLVKAAVVDRLGGRPALSAVSVSYRAPERENEVRGESGSHEAIWLDEADGDQANVVFGGLPLWLDETYSLKLVVQVLRPSSDGEQQTADERVDELLYEVLAEMTNDPTFGIDPDEHGGVEHLQVTFATFTRRTGFLEQSGGHAASAELELQVEARLSFDQ